MRNFNLIIILFLFSGCSIINLDSNHHHLKKHVKYLASDELEGRYPASNGGFLAATYIKDQFKNLNLELLGDDGFQYFDIVSSVSLGNNNNLVFENKSYEVNNDFIPLSFGKNTSLTSEIFFTGYGFIIDTDSLYWNDYKNIEIKDKWVMILRGSPEGDNPHSAFGEHLSLRKKVLNAKDNSAAGVIFVSGENFDKEDNLVELSYDQSQQDLGIPIIHIKRDLANTILSSNNTSVQILEENIDKNFKSFNISKELSVNTEIIFNKKKTQNVLGCIKGNDSLLKDEYIVIGAHYDHLGYGGYKSGSRRPHLNQIHNGADDNASGVSILIELVKSIKKIKNKRSILFIAFGAEEMGLIGSKYFVNNKLIEHDKIQIMINMDMVGKLKEEKVLSVSGTKTGIDLEKFLIESFNNSKLSFVFDEKGYGPSDHSSFYVNDIPVLSFFTGGHSDYHTPLDDYQKLNYSGMYLIKELVSEVILTIDGKPKIKFQESGSKKRKQMPSRFKVTLGIMPDYVYNKTKGLRVDAVLPGKSAYNGGMKDGDIIIKMGNKSVNDIYEYMHRLSEYSDGDKTEVVVMRNNEEVLLEVIF
tara:strand:- start:739 stop:2493 length:1755 start_codon:yes stop_codon:yes gene_type:complete